MDLDKKLYEKPHYEGAIFWYCAQCDLEYLWFDLEYQEKKYGVIECVLCPCKMDPVYGYKPAEMINSLLDLLKSRHYLAAIIIFSSYIEYHINSLLWSCLLDSGADIEEAKKISYESRLLRKDALKKIGSLLGKEIDHLVFPGRNEAAHGKLFGQSSQYYVGKIKEQIINIKKFVDEICNDIEITYDKNTLTGGYFPSPIRTDGKYIYYWVVYMELVLPFVEEKMENIFQNHLIS